MPEGPQRAALMVAGAGAVLVLVGLFGLVGSLVGLAALAAGTLLASRVRARRAIGDVDWWRMLAAGSGLVAVGIAVGLGLDSVGGLIEAVGAGLGVVAVALALP